MNFRVFRLYWIRKLASAKNGEHPSFVRENEYYIFILYSMGNNHDKFFSKNKRKVLVLGITNAGKSSIIRRI